jgi:hypothetical protein
MRLISDLGTGRNSVVPLAPAAHTGIVRDRAWWAKESARLGTDWPGVIDAAVSMLTVAGLVAPETSTFQQACEQADRRRQYISSGRVAPPRNRRAPEIEALVFSLRRGVGELTQPDTQRRLSALDANQLEAVCLRVQAFQPTIAEPWTAEDADLLISTWRKLRGQH